MKIAGIILLVLQAISLLGAVANGSIATMFDFSSGYALGELVGFFIPTIVGVFLLVKASKKAKKTEADKQQQNEN